MGDYQLGRVFSRAFGMIRDGIGTVGVFLLLVTLVGQGLNWLFQQQMIAEIQQAVGKGGDSNGFGIFSSIWYWLQILVNLAIGAFCYAGAISGYMAEARRESFSFRQCFVFGITLLLPVFGLTLVWWILVLIGLILLIIPGVFMIVSWSVAMPVLIDQRLGVLDSLSRSNKLTEGSRTMVLLTLIALMVLIYAPAVALGVGLVSSGQAGQLAALADKSFEPTVLILAAGYGWVEAMLVSAFLASIYLETLEVKGAPVDSGLLDVFE